MSWREASEDDLAATLSKKEIDAYRALPGWGGGDPVETLIKRTAALVRSFCRRNTGMKFSPVAYEMPEALISPAMDYAAYDLLKRLPLKVGEDRRLAREQALDLFKDVAANRLTPESFGEEEPTQSTEAVSPLVAKRAHPRRLLD